MRHGNDKYSIEIKHSVKDINSYTFRLSVQKEIKSAARQVQSEVRDSTFVHKIRIKCMT